MVDVLQGTKGIQIKRKPGASGSKAALRDPVLELEIQSKILTDDGLAELAQGVAHIYHANTQDRTFIRLEELNLRDNGLTPRSFSYLTAIIGNASFDLRDLDLSDNILSIQSAEDLDLWEQFLRALSTCCTLRRLDLSNNTLGWKAYELLARVYSQEDPVDFVLPTNLSPVQEFFRPNDATRKLSIDFPLDDQASHDEDPIRTTTRKGSRHGVSGCCCNAERS